LRDVIRQELSDVRTPHCIRINLCTADIDLQLPPFAESIYLNSADFSFVRGSCGITLPSHVQFSRFFARVFPLSYEAHRVDRRFGGSPVCLMSVASVFRIKLTKMEIRVAKFCTLMIPWYEKLFLVQKVKGRGYMGRKHMQGVHGLRC